MKHFWFALALLAALVGTALLANGRLAKENDAITAPLMQALEASCAGNDALAADLAKEAAARWDAALPCFSSLLGHAELDAVSIGFARLCDTEGAAFRAQCLELLTQLRHLRELDRPTPENVL